MSKLASQMKTEGIPPNTSSQIMEILENNNNAQITLNTSLTEIIKTVATVLAGAVTTIIGFYFGNKAATEAKTEDKGPEPVKDKGPGSGPEPVKDKGPGSGPEPVKDKGPEPVKDKGPEPMKREGPEPGTVSST